MVKDMTPTQCAYFRGVIIGSYTEMEYLKKQSSS